MAPRKDLVALTTKEALVEKVTGNRKRPTPAVKERNFCHLMRDPSRPKEVSLAPVEKVDEGLLDLVAMMPPHFPFGRSIEEGSSRTSRAAHERIRGALLPNNIKAF